MFSTNSDDVPTQLQSAFGEQKVEGKTPKIVASAVYNLVPANFRTFTASGGSITAANNEFIASNGTTVFAYGAMQSFRSLNIQPGSGAGVRFGARFPDVVPLTWQGVGLAGIGDEVSFGRGTSGAFGVWHRHGGFPEVRTFQVTAAATGAETVTFTVNGTAYSIPVTSGTVQQNAHEIASYLESNGVGFDAFQNNDIVTISFTSDGAKSGTYSSSSTGTLAGTFTQVTAGVGGTDDFVEQDDWNHSPPAGFDPTKGNQYQITYSTGYGNINYYIFDHNNGQWIKVHTVEWQNNQDAVNLNNPSLRAIVYCYSIGATTNASVYCPFISAFISGEAVITRNPRSFSNTKSIAGTETCIFQLRNRKVYNGIQNQAEILPVRLTVSNEGSKNVTIRISGNPTVGGTPNFQDVGTNLISEVDTAATTRTGGRPLDSLTVGPGQSADVDLSDIVAPPTLRLVVSAVKPGGGAASDVTASIKWIEDL